MTTIVTVNAIDELGKQLPKVEMAFPPDGHDTEERLRIWAADPAGHNRPRCTIVAMAAMAWSNVLEGFFRGISETAVDAKAIARVKAVFGCQIHPTVERAVRALIAFRNDVTHPQRGRTHDEHRTSPSADEWAARAFAVRVLAGTVIRSLADRLDDRRAAGEAILLFPGAE